MATANSSGASLAPRPELDINREVAFMRQMKVNELRVKFAEVFGEETKSRNKVWMIKRIAWRMQANAYGGLSERALARAKELANEADLRLTAPRQPKPAADAIERTQTVKVSIKPNRQALMPGTMLSRVYKRKTCVVYVRPDGQFEYEGKIYKSLSKIATVITGLHWGGYHFFNINK